MKLGLNEDQREMLHELVNSNGWQPLLTVIDRLATSIDSNVMKYNLSSGPEGLVIEKARAEGARKLQMAITSIKSEFKKADLGF